MRQSQLLLLNQNYTSKYLQHTLKLLVAQRIKKYCLAIAAKSQAYQFNSHSPSLLFSPIPSS